MVDMFWRRTKAAGASGRKGKGKVEQAAEAWEQGQGRWWRQQQGEQSDGEGEGGVSSEVARAGTRAMAVGARERQ